MKNRPERLICFLVVWLTMFSCIGVRGQKFYPESLKNDFLQLRYPGTPGDHRGIGNVILDKKDMIEVAPFTFLITNLDFDGLTSHADGMYSQPTDLYYIQSGFFCKREWELEKTTHIPFRIRLGSLADCNALEGKH
jgi:hypothetical protein